jgi:hypothetical protein
MTTDIVRHDGGSTLQEKVEWAKTLAVANLLPPQYQGNPGNLLYAVEYADALGIDRINAITSIHVIQGKPTASAELIASLVRRAGHKLRVSGDDTKAVAQIIRADDPDYTFEATWDIAKAQAAGLWGKGNWRNYPGAMLRARAITEVARAGASDALYGVVYTPDELGATVNAEGAPVDAGAVTPREEVVDGELVVEGQEPLPVEDPPDVDLIDDKQTKLLHTIVSKLGLTREQKLEGAAKVVGHPVESTSELTKNEAAAVIAALKDAEKRQKANA